VTTTALYRGQVVHARHRPVHHRFRYGVYMWLVDLDRPPRVPRLLRPFAGIRSRDHLGDPRRTIRENVDAFLAKNGIDLGGGRVLMLANARVLGYVFNPLTVYWCHRPDGGLRCILAEVHNTYGERHCYLLTPDEQGRATFAKEFYVSPFYPVDGEYVMRLPEPGERLALSVELHRGDARPFVATVRGRRRAADSRALLRAALRVPLATLTVAAQIRYQGITLWARRLPVVPRPTHEAQPEVQ